LELLTKGRSLANQLKCQLEAVVAGTNLKDVLKSKSFLMVLTNYMFLTPKVCILILHCPSSILVNLFKEEKPQVCLMGATVIGRDLGPRVSSALTSGLTADCTALEIGDHEDKKEGKTYKNLLYQIRPALAVTLLQPLSTPNIVRRWLLFAKV
jgi:electron transfer flavoprotein alpha subunit